MATATSSRSSTVVLIARNAFTGHLLIPRRHQNPVTSTFECRLHMGKRHGGSRGSHTGSSSEENTNTPTRPPPKTAKMASGGEVSLTSLPPDLKNLAQLMFAPNGEERRARAKADVVIRGKLVRKDEICTQILDEFLTKELDMDFKPPIVAVHRLSRPSTTRPNPALLVRFFNYHDRDKVLFEGRKLRGKGMAVYEHPPY
ncbi:hypothetical protein Bbelb_242420 [Branchiostoma belcheri]|nr:hypothetical protein Bbelb_242420 [Branchiostoma belcheri]